MERQVYVGGGWEESNAEREDGGGGRQECVHVHMHTHLHTPWGARSGPAGVRILPEMPPLQFYSWALVSEQD